MAEPREPDQLYIVDGSGFIFRAYHALPPLTTRAGLPAGAVFGFTGMLMKLDFDKRPSHLVVVFDASVSSFRHSIFPAYKANRAAPPEDLAPQFGMVRRVVDAFGVPRIEAVGVEADDVIAALVRQARLEGMRVKIVSSDKDLMQLVDEPACVLWDTMKDKIYDSEAVREKFGVGPREVGDVLALMGDSVDNIPGVRGVGPKTASALIQHFGSLDETFRRIDEVEKIPGLRGAKSVAEKLRANEADARLSRQLVALDDTVPLSRTLASLVRVEPDLDQVEKALIDLDFTRLLDRLRGLRGDRVATERRALAPTPTPPPAPSGLGPFLLPWGHWYGPNDGTDESHSGYQANDRANVARIQTALIAAGHPLPRFGADGRYGGETTTAAQAFQRVHGLVDDGLVGRDTWASL